MGKGKKKRIKRQLRKSGGKFKPDYLASCYGKIRHGSYEEASIAASEKPSIVKPYKCRHCKYYHIGRRK